MLQHRHAWLNALHQPASVKSSMAQRTALAAALGLVLLLQCFAVQANAAALLDPYVDLPTDPFSSCQSAEVVKAVAAAFFGGALPQTCRMLDNVFYDPLSPSARYVMRPN